MVVWIEEKRIVNRVVFNWLFWLSRCLDEVCVNVWSNEHGASPLFVMGRELEIGVEDLGACV